MSSRRSAPIPIGFKRVDAPEEEPFAAFIHKIAENTVNYCPLWIGHNVFDVEHVRSREYDSDRAARLQRFLDLAGSKEIRAKLRLEHFRGIAAQQNRWRRGSWK